VNHQQAVVIELDRHHLQSNPILVIAEEDEPRASVRWSLAGRVLLEAQTTVLDDVARALTGYSVLGRGASPISDPLTQSTNSVGQY
jgi:hypothetical protein